jgi:phage baseplate assembly protein W
MDIDYPYHIDASGRTARTNSDDHIRDLIEAVLFTAPGERVNRPTFGSGLMQLVFAPSGGDMATATQLLVQSALQQWLGDLILVEDVRVTSIDSILEVSVQYVVRRDQERQVAQFQRSA